MVPGAGAGKRGKSAPALSHPSRPTWQPLELEARGRLGEADVRVVSRATELTRNSGKEAGGLGL